MTVVVVFSVVLLSLLIGVPAAYALARKDFRGKKLLTLLFLLRDRVLSWQKGTVKW